MKILKELAAAGFRPVAIPSCEGTCVSGGECAVVLSQESTGGLRILAPPLLVSKKTEVEVTSARSNELGTFRVDLSRILQAACAQ